MDPGWILHLRSIKKLEMREGAGWVVREGVGAGGEMNQALYAHMNNKRKRKK
jgi:NaMN:DMB phosphoribosyltransferase